MNFKEYLKEAKQVGNIHHFTTVNSLHHMLHQDRPFHLYSRNGENVSFSRNPHLPMMNHNFKSCDVRITVDGDKLSEHHKIKPVAGLADESKGVFDHTKTNRIKRNSSEAEETVVKHPVNILPHIKHIHIISHPKLTEHYQNVLKPKLDSLNISHTYSKSFSRTSLEEDYIFTSWEEQWILI